MADVFPQTLRLELGVALVAQRPAAALDEPQVGQLDVAVLAPEAARVPVLVHRLDHPPDDELPAFSAAWGEQHLKVVLAVLPALELEERSVFEHLETLRATKGEKVRCKSINIFHSLKKFKYK